MGYYSAALAFVLAFLLLRLLLRPSARRLLLDRPNHRSLHSAPVPRSGGLAVIPSLALGMSLAGGTGGILSLALGLMLLSLVDDWKNLTAPVRFLAHLAAALGVVYMIGETRWPVAILLVLWIGWMTNLYNFMDGADGLAGGMGVIGFSTYALAAWMAGAPQFCTVSLSVACACAAFLGFNFPPARIFMGDAGSIPLGFLAAALGLLGWQANLWPPWFPAVVFAPFVWDATLTLARRAMRGKRIWEAHREHYYQRLIQMGWTHRRTALMEYALMIVCAAAALAARTGSALGQVAALAGLAVMATVLSAWVDRNWRRTRNA